MKNEIASGPEALRNDNERELQSLAQETLKLLQSLQAKGIKEVRGNPQEKSVRAELVEARTGTEKETVLRPVREEALACKKCRLCEGRKTVVFGEGSLDAQIVFVGEGPGRDEDLQGRPFVGAAGTLLTKIIQAMKLTRESVYIANVVKCRPPNNRPPEPDEIEACSSYLAAQLLTIRPKLICAMGRTAVMALLGTQAPMNSLRGRSFDWNGIPLIITFHPAYLLRNPSAKKDVWEDMQRALAVISRPLRLRSGQAAAEKSGF